MLKVVTDSNGAYTVVGGFMPMLLTGVRDPEEEAVKAARLLCEHLIAGEGVEGLLRYIESRVRHDIQEVLRTNGNKNL